MGISAFGVDDSRISKARGDKEKAAAAATGVGSVAAGGVAVGHVAQAANHSTNAKSHVRVVGRMERSAETMREAYRKSPRTKAHGDQAASHIRQYRDIAGQHMDHALSERAAGVKAAGKAIRAGKVAGVTALAAGGLAGTGAYRSRKNVAKSREGSEMNYSAFGVQDDRISKADDEPRPKASAGRIATGALVPSWHGAIAGRKGHKLRAIGNEFGGGLLGGAAGRGAGALATAATRGKVKGLRIGGGVTGSLAGGATGTVRAQKKGHLKREDNS